MLQIPIGTFLIEFFDHLLNKHKGEQRGKLPCIITVRVARKIF